MRHTSIRCECRCCWPQIHPAGSRVTRATVLIVNDALARQLFPKQNPIGRVLLMGPLVLTNAKPLSESWPGRRSSDSRLRSVRRSFCPPGRSARWRLWSALPPTRAACPTRSRRKSGADKNLPSPRSRLWNNICGTSTPSDGSTYCCYPVSPHWRWRWRQSALRGVVVPRHVANPRDRDSHGARRDSQRCVAAGAAQDWNSRSLALPWGLLPDWH